MKLVDGEVVSTDEDYMLTPNVVHENVIGDYRAFRVLTENGQLFAAVIAKNAPNHQQAATGLLVKERAERAPHLAVVR